jgi:hypothetical protein
MISDARRELYYWQHIARELEPPSVLPGALVYVAGPFSVETEQGIEDNVDRARVAGIKLMLCGYPVVIPHANTSGMQHLRWPHEHWMAVDLEILYHCASVLMMKGWAASKGASIEHSYALKHELLVAYEPDTWVVMLAPNGVCTPGRRNPFMDTFVPFAQKEV